MRIHFRYILPSNVRSCGVAAIINAALETTCDKETDNYCFDNVLDEWRRQQREFLLTSASSCRPRQGDKVDFSLL